ncbi:MAG: DNA/RNA non-specific endonuclease, partial [Nodosilinea sp.]
MTVLTHGFTLLPTATGIPESHYEMADHIAKANGAENPGLILRYDKTTGNWIPVDKLGRTLSNIVGISPESSGYMERLASAIKSNYLHKPLVLLPEWAKDRESIIPDAGFTEAAADAFFAAIVALDRVLMDIVDGQSRPSQGALLDSPLHFIGFSRGAVVNSEIIQRLGTYFPNAGGVVRDAQGQVIKGDLQMTTIDPHDFDQPSLGPVYRDFKEPEVKVWENVTFADNYYQTVAPKDGTFTFTPRGREIAGIPSGASVNLDGRAGFTEDNKLGGPHTATFAWYAGTVGFDIDQINLDGRFSTQYPTDPQSYPIYDRAGEGDVGQLSGVDGSEPLRTWYSQAGSSEGLGTGWFYSVLGGGKESRPGAPLITTPLYQDNTNTDVSGGDFAVPTVFNGNFDASYIPDEIFRNIISKELPGWSFHNSEISTPVSPTDLLVDWTQVASLAEHKDKLGISQSNYALKLESGDSITHNRFVVPDWGVLRFDLYAPDLGDGSLRITLRDEDGNVVTAPSEIFLQPAIGTATSYLTDTRRIGYGQRGFETFTINIPESLRSKTATLSFELADAINFVLLDNVFFKSQHLLLGNPALDGQEARNGSGANKNNFLVEKPQYAASYNEDNKGSNWVSWYTDKTWLGDFKSIGKEDAASDPNYPYRSVDYAWMPDEFLLRNNVGTSIPTDYAVNDGINGAPTYDRGHLVADSYRNRTRKDQVSTYLTTNVLPQESGTNRFGAWRRFEDFGESLVDTKGWNLYTIAGSLGVLGEDLPDLEPGRLKSEHGIETPEEIWKVMVALRPGQGLQDIDTNTPVIGTIFPNFRTFTNDPDAPDPSQWSTWIYSVDEIERRTGLDLLSNLRDDVEEELEKYSYSGPVFANAFPQPKPLIAPFFAASNLIERHRRTVGHSRVVENDITNPGIIHPIFQENTSLAQINISQISSSNERDTYFSPNQNSASQINIDQSNRSQIGITEIGITQVSPHQNTFGDSGVTEVSLGQVSTLQVSPSQISPTQVSSTEVSLIEVGLTQSGSAQVDVGKFGFFKTNPPLKADSAEISLASSIALQQLFSGHNSISQNETTWTDFFNAEGLDLDFEIKDLSIGQLAETQITHFDNYGHPIAGTIYIDDDANGKGWFIDSTPWESSEFSTRNTEYNYEAQEGSAAYDRYDLLTTILHELSHFSGFIGGHEHFNAYVEDGIFRDGDLIATITADGSHIADNPYSLLSPYLTPGMRKLPSELELRLLEAIRNHNDHDGTIHTQGSISAAQTATPFVGITNGDFEQLLAQWNNRGAVQTIQLTASTAVTLTEDSPILSQLS